MDITQNKIDDLNTKVSINLQPADYKDKVKDQLKEYAKKVNLPGFRPGKVPIGLVRKMAGVGMVIETVTKILQEELNDFIDTHELRLLGEPLPVEKRGEEYFDINCEKELDFEFEMGLAPEIALNLSLDKPVTRYEIEIDDAYLTKHLDDLRDRHGDLVYPETVEESAIVFGKLDEINADGEVVENGFTKMLALNPQRLEVPDFFAPYMGKKIDDVVPFSLETVDKEADELKKIFTLEDDELTAIQEKKMQFTVKRISKITLAEINEEFIKKVLGEDTEITIEEDFKADMRKKLIDELAESAKYHSRHKIREAVEGNHEIPLPDEFLKRWLVETREKITEENVEEEYKGLKSSTIWGLLVNEIQQAYPESKIENEDLEAYVTSQMKENMGEELGEEQLKQYVDYVLKNEQMGQQYYYRLLDERIFDVIESQITIEHETISATDFVELDK